MTRNRVRKIDPRRRNFLLLFAAGTLHCLLPAPIGAAVTQFLRATPQDRALRTLRETFGNLAAAKIVGQQYLQTYPSEVSSVDEFAQQALSAPSKGLGDPNRWIQDQRMRDFDNDDIVILHGWIISRTEARLCALASLAWAPARVSGA